MVRLQKMQSFWSILYGSTPAEFKSDYSLADSIAHLRAATQRFAFRALGGPAAVGRVTESTVRLQRVIPMVHNSFKPFFTGHFETRGDGTYLTGRFSMLLFVKAFMTLWLGLCLAFAVLPWFLIHGVHDAPWWFSLSALGMFGVGIAFVALCKWFARNDTAWLSEVIGSALTKPTTIRPSSAIATPLPPGASERPMVVIVAAACLLLMGLIGLVAAATGISSYQASPHHVAITHFSSWVGRAAAGVCALVTISLAVGIYHQQRWAWRLGLIYVGVAWLYSAFDMFCFSQIPAIVKSVFLVLSFAVAIYWGLWWYAQRVHFPNTESRTH